MDFSNLERVLEAGQKLHLEGEKLQQFVQQAIDREERMRERDETRRREEREELKRREEMEEARRREEMEKTRRREDMEEARRREEMEDARRREEMEEVRRREEMEETRRREEMEEARRREEVEDARQREEREETRRRENIEWEREKEERERARVHEIEMKNIELQAAQLTEQGHRAGAQVEASATPKLPPFVDEKDDIDCYLQRFERFARSLSWPTETWATRLSALLTGRALDVYSRIPDEDAEDYDALKQALLIRYDMTENGFRLKFRRSKPETGECSKQYLSRLTGYLTRWIDLSKTPKTFEGIRDLMVKEQYTDSCPRDLTIHLRERVPENLAQMAEISEKYLAAHDQPLASSQPRSDLPIQANRMGPHNRPSSGRSTTDDGRTRECRTSQARQRRRPRRTEGGCHRNDVSARARYHAR